MELRWEDGFRIRTSVQNGEIVITANREGLISLARNIKALAEQDPGAHIHLDSYNSLEDGSVELIIDHE
ncbi:MAG: hypothetical protein IKZ63_03655 [Oscillospiraceae bacterium]|nr:hypothetical protein [Oscillospiraceae bacterium]